MVFNRVTKKNKQTKKTTHLQCRRPWFASWSGRSPREGIGCPLQYSWASLVAQLVKNLPAMNAGDLGLIRGLGRSPGEGKGYPLPVLIWRIPWTVTKTGTRLSDFPFTFTVVTELCKYYGNSRTFHHPRNEPVTVSSHRLCPALPARGGRCLLSASGELTTPASICSPCDARF